MQNKAHLIDSAHESNPEGGVFEDAYVDEINEMLRPVTTRVKGYRNAGLSVSTCGGLYTNKKPAYKTIIPVRLFFDKWREIIENGPMYYFAIASREQKRYSLDSTSGVS